MEKLSKVLLSFMFLFLTLFVVNLTVQAEETTEIDAILIYAHVPEGWENPHVWTWNEAGDSAYAHLGWPGKAMVEDEANEGWYYLYIPSNMENIIVNANEGSVQTDVIAVSENVWLSVTIDVDPEDAEETIVVVDESTVQLTTGDLPEYIPTKYVYAYVPIDWDTAGIWAWEHPVGVNVFPNWPGAEMELLSDGWFRIEIPVAANRIIINDMGDPTIQTVDIDIPDTNVYVLVGDENEDGKFEVTLDDTKPVIIEGGFTVTITVPEGWSEPRVWAWSHPDGTNLFTTWPGEVLEFDEEANAYVIILPEWINRIIINNGIVGEGAAQTVDLELINPVDTVIVVSNEPDNDGKFTATIVQEGDDEPGDDEPGDDEPGDDEPGDDEPGDDDPADEESNNVVMIVAIVVVALGAITTGALYFVKRS
ncbi:MAG: starch-binding protein [Candidatus Izemoplasmataceae bacterium]